MLNNWRPSDDFDWGAVGRVVISVVAILCYIVILMCIGWALLLVHPMLAVGGVATCILFTVLCILVVENW